MHYLNGRKAKVGDIIMNKDYLGVIRHGVVIAAIADSDSCNLVVAPYNPANISHYTARECVHVDDAFQALTPQVDPHPGK